MWLFLFSACTQTHIHRVTRAHTHMHTQWAVIPPEHARALGRTGIFLFKEQTTHRSVGTMVAELRKISCGGGESTHADTVASVMYSHTNNNTHSHIKIHRIDRFWTLCIPAGCMRHFNTHLHSRKPPCGAHGRMGIFVVTYRKSRSGM